MRPLAVPVLAGLVLLVATLAGAPPAGAVGTDEEPGRSTGLELIEMDPWVGADTTVTATVATGDGARAHTVTPTLYDAVSTRSAFELTTRGENLTVPLRQLDDLEVRRGTNRAELRFRVTDGTGGAEDPDRDQEVVLSQPGVYPLVFTTHDADGIQTDRLVTYLVRLPDRPDEGDNGTHPLTVATQLRLQPRPTADADGEPTTTAAAIGAADALISGVTGDDQLLQPARRGIGYAISPAFVDAARATGHPDLVDELAVITTGHPVQPQPWAPVSLGPWLATPGLAEQVARSTDQGVATLTEHLDEPDPTVADLVAWGGDLSEEALGWLADRGSAGFLIADEELEGLDPGTFPRTLAAPFLVDTSVGPRPAMALDSGLAEHFTTPDPALGANHLIADLAVIALDLPSIRRGVVVAPPPGWTPSAEMIGAYLDTLEAEPPRGSDALLVPDSVEALLDAVPAARAAGDTVGEGEPLTRQLVAHAATVPAGLAEQVRRSAELIESLAGMEPGGATESAVTTTRLEHQVALAAMPGVPAPERSERFTGIRDRITDTATDIGLSERQTITMTSQDASLPITIRRETDGPTRVTLHIDAPDRLSFPDGRNRTVDLDDPVTRFDLRVHADSPGDTLIRLTVTSPDSRLVAGTTDLMVRSTTASGVGLVISFGSLAFLVIWWGRDIVRTRRRRRAERIPPAELIDID